jgi:hypothetical protein
MTMRRVPCTSRPPDTLPEATESYVIRARLVKLGLALVVLALAVQGCGGGGGGSSSANLGIPIPWVRAEPSGSALRVGYETDPCTRARRARVDESGRVVKVTLGDPERDPKKACIGVVERHCALVRLAGPLGTRKVVDGAPHARPRSREIPIEAYGTCRPVPAASD